MRGRSSLWRRSRVALLPVLWQVDDRKLEVVDMIDTAVRIFTVLAAMAGITIVLWAVVAIVIWVVRGDNDL